MEPINKEALIELLKTYSVMVTFTKVDKTIREMFCTLKQEWLPTNTSYTEVPNGAGNRPITVWDIEAAAWRSIKPETIIKLEIIA